MRQLQSLFFWNKNSPYSGSLRTHLLQELCGHEIAREYKRSTVCCLLAVQHDSGDQAQHKDIEGSRADKQLGASWRA